MKQAELDLRLRLRRESLEAFINEHYWPRWLMWMDPAMYAVEAAKAELKAMDTAGI